MTAWVLLYIESHVNSPYNRLLTNNITAVFAIFRTFRTLPNIRSLSLTIQEF
jgi:hypothetical protein